MERQPQPDDLEVPEIGVETTLPLNSTLNQQGIDEPENTVFPQPHRSTDYCKAVEDARGKHLKIRLVMLTNSELERYLCTKTDNDYSIKLDNVMNVEAHKSVSNTSSTVTPCCAPVNYAESSASEGGSIHGDTTDSDWNDESLGKNKPAAQRHGPSKSRIAAQRLIVASKPSVKTVPEQDTDQKSSSGSSRSHSPDSNHSSVSKHGSKPKPKGKLSIKTHGIRKTKKERTFSCKLCEYQSDCVKLLNEHHIEDHDPVPCTECDHVSSTPSAHDRHMYKHKQRNFACDECDQTFAFNSELTAHKYSHRTERSFECMAANCNKTFKSDGELQKHVKKHKGTLWYCDCCKYNTADKRNLQKHMIVHTKKMPHVCGKCGQSFKWYEQLKRHRKNKKDCPKA